MLRRHLGVLRALRERDVEIDYVGGTSMGAVLAVLVASDQPQDLPMHAVRRAFARNPTGDFNFVPLVSLFGGMRRVRALRQAVIDVFGREPDIEDLWKNYFCIATNYSQAREEVLQHGDLQAAVLASGAIPGALPPLVRNGDLLCDGATFNNFPVDVMRARRGVGCVIASTSARASRARSSSPKCPARGRSCSTACGRASRADSTCRRFRRSCSTRRSCTASRAYPCPRAWSTSTSSPRSSA